MDQKSVPKTLKLVSLKKQNNSVLLKGKVSCSFYLAILNKAPFDKTLDELVENAVSALSDMDAQTIKKEWGKIALDFISKGILSITIDKPSQVITFSEKPKAFSIARMQGQTSDLVTNLRHEEIKLSINHLLVLQYLTGENTQEQIVKFIKERVQKGELIGKIANGQTLKDSLELDHQLSLFVNESIRYIALQSLLVG